MKNSALIFLLSLAACAIPPFEDNVKVFPPTKDAMVVRQVRYVSHTASTLSFEIDLYHLKGYDYGHLVLPGFFYNDFGLDTTYFQFPSTGNFILKGSDRFTGISSVPSSSVILVDESGSYDTLDHFNSRSQGITKLCQDFASPGQFLLGGFSQNGDLKDEPVEFYQTNFSTYTEKQLPFIFDLSKKTGGQSNLYDAVDNSLDHLISEGSSSKNIIILAHSKDESSTALPDQLITKANANQIQIHIIFRGNEEDAHSLAKLAEGTHGTFATCPSVGEMMCSFENLYSVLDAADQVYRLTIKYIPTSGTIVSGQEFLFTIKTHDQYFDIDNNPLVAYVKVP